MCHLRQGLKIHIFKEINAFIQQTFIKLIQSDSKDMYNVKNYLYFK